MHLQNAYIYSHAPVTIGKKQLVAICVKHHENKRFLPAVAAEEIDNATRLVANKSVTAGSTRNKQVKVKYNGVRLQLHYQCETPRQLAHLHNSCSTSFSSTKSQRAWINICITHIIFWATPRSHRWDRWVWGFGRWPNYRTYSIQHRRISFTAD